MTFTDVSASVEGNYLLTVTFTEGDTSGGREATVCVDGANYVEYFPGNGNWNGVQALRMMVHLVPGNNSVEFSNPSAFGPDIAAIVV